MIELKVRKLGNSLGVVLPKVVVSRLDSILPTPPTPIWSASFSN
jgi:hypothetical protein